MGAADSASAESPRYTASSKEKVVPDFTSAGAALANRATYAPQPGSQPRNAKAACHVSIMASLRGFMIAASSPA